MIAAQARSACKDKDLPPNVYILTTKAGIKTYVFSMKFKDIPITPPRQWGNLPCTPDSLTVIGQMADQLRVYFRDDLEFNDSDLSGFSMGGYAAVKALIASEEWKSTLHGKWAVVKKAEVLNAWEATKRKRVINRSVDPERRKLLNDQMSRIEG